MLFDELDDIARHRGSHELVSLVDNKNFASMSLHRKSGFRAFS
ncbi:hypothetical protein CLAC_08135 [Corynebacterium lactis RW2-5]|uniref:Uncharacterized protein n=2 Tax=Corynebacterium lactis TaxID=1231000 RepID=A0A0K2H3Q8_9CORY|nr:hypothetical protein CLAC_08135 [Corynebacterium lactis RW2-5]